MCVNRRSSEAPSREAIFYLAPKAPPCPPNIQYESNNTCVLRISRTLKRSEFGTDWNDLDFLLSHGNEIAKIAGVGEPSWELEALALAGAGFRLAR